MQYGKSLLQYPLELFLMGAHAPIVSKPATSMSLLLMKQFPAPKYKEGWVEGEGGV